ncbi:19615_t:CDS:2 [Rhizophagus irregularis]|nr:19615_t:CDS:2 [Rhizophagus irregularis]
MGLTQMVLGSSFPSPDLLTIPVSTTFNPYHLKLLMYLAEDAVQ